MHDAVLLICSRHLRQKRAWCRAEQFCYLLKNGNSNMWIADKLGWTERVESSWLDEALLIFEGEMTCWCAATAQQLVTTCTCS